MSKQVYQDLIEAERLSRDTIRTIELNAPHPKISKDDQAERDRERSALEDRARAAAQRTAGEIAAQYQ